MAKEESIIQEGELRLFVGTWNMHGQVYQNSDMIN